MAAPLLRRALRLYVINATIAIAIVWTAIHGFLHLPWPAFLTSEYVALKKVAMVETSIFLNLPWLCDILPAYVLFIPLALVLAVAQHKGKIGWVVGASVLLWVLGQWHPMDHLATSLEALFPGRKIELGWFELTAWQLVFTMGFVLGLYGRKGRLPRHLAEPAWPVLLAALVIVAMLTLDRHGLALLPRDVVEKWAAKRTLGPLRLVNFLSLVIIIRGFWPKLARLFGHRWLTRLGEESLAVFVYHVIAVYVLAILAEKFGAFPAAPAAAIMGLAIVAAYVTAQGSRSYRLGTNKLRNRKTIQSLTVVAHPEAADFKP